MERLGKLILGAILGGVLGAGIGLLLAPKSGKQLREDVADYADHIRSEVQRASDQRRVELERELTLLRQPEPGSK